MKGYSFLVNKQFKVNRRRMVFTIIGIILGIVLFISVGYINNFMREVKVAEAKATYGNYEVTFLDLDCEKIELLRNNVKVKECGIYGIDNYENIIINNVKKDLEIRALDSISMEVIFKPTIKITEGHLPNNSEELILTIAAKSDYDKKIGDKLVLGNNYYTIVGFYEGEYNDPFTLKGITTFQQGKNYSKINGAINIKKIKNSKETILEIGKAIGIERINELVDSQVLYNYMLLDAYGESVIAGIGQGIEDTLLMWFINGIILILTSILTYGSINVSMKERIKQFSALRCIGATPDKIRYLLIKEGIFLGTLSILPGLVIGHGVALIVIKGVFEKIININTYGVTLKIYWQVIFISIFLTLITIFISAFIPVMRAGRISPVVGVKTGGSSIRKTKYRKSKVIRRVFGYEGELAYKNIRADNKSFIVTTTILATLLIVFVGFTGFYMVVNQSYRGERKAGYRDFTIDYYNHIKEIPQKGSHQNIIEEELNNIDIHKDYLKSTNAVSHIMSKININIEPLFEDIVSRNVLKTEKIKSVGGESYSFIDHGTIYLYDEEALKTILPYVKGHNITLEDFKNNGIVIVNTNIRGIDFTRRSEEVYQVNYGDRLKLYLEDKYDEHPLREDFSEENIKKVAVQSNLIDVKVLGTIDSINTLESKSIEYATGIYIIASRDFYLNNKEVFEKNGYINNGITIDGNYINPIKKAQCISQIKGYTNKIGGWYIDNELEQEKIVRSITGMIILIYIVLFLAMAISVLNIVNNKYINISLRRKELGAMLSIGMTREKLKKVILLEGVVQWFIASLIGSIISYLVLKGLYISYAYMGSIDKANPPLMIIILGVLLLLIINLITSSMPLRKLKTLDIIEFIREEE